MGVTTFITSFIIRHQTVKSSHQRSVWHLSFNSRSQNRANIIPIIDLSGFNALDGVCGLDGFSFNVGHITWVRDDVITVNLWFFCSSSPHSPDQQLCSLDFIPSICLSLYPSDSLALSLSLSGSLAPSVCLKSFTLSPSFSSLIVLFSSSLILERISLLFSRLQNNSLVGDN